MLGGTPGMPPGRGMELELETGDVRMPQSRQVKRLSNGELAELCAQLIDLLDRGCIQHSTPGHAEAVVFARKPDGSWRICYDYRGLNAITRPAVGLPGPVVHSLTLEQHLLRRVDVEEVLEIFHLHQLFAKSSSAGLGGKN